MVGNVTIQGQIVGTATFDGAKIRAVVTIAPHINATVVFGRSGVTVHNQLTDRDAEDVHPIESISSPINNSSNVYEWIRSTLLTRLAAFTDAVIVSTDTILSAFAKLQGQLNAVKVRLGLLEDNVIVDITLTEQTAILSISLDKNYVPLNLSDFEIIVNGKSAVYSNNGIITLNDNVNSIYWNGIANSILPYFLLYSTGGAGNRFSGMFRFRKSGGKYVFNHNSSDSPSGSARTVNYNGIITADIGNVTSIKINANGSKWDIGTNIKIVRL